MPLSSVLSPHRARWAAIVWGIFLLTITSWPSPPEIPGLSSILHFDKLVHVLLYSGEGFLLYFSVAWPAGPRFSWLRVLAIGGFLTICGLLDEIHQIWIPGRGMEMSDVATDAIGGFCGALVASAVSVGRRRQESGGVGSR